MKGTRLIDDNELRDSLRYLKKFGVQVPILNLSNYSPRYVGTKNDGTEIYNHRGRVLEVHHGEVIDSHGNVVNLRLLESKILIIPIKNKEEEFKPSLVDYTISQNE